MVALMRCLLALSALLVMVFNPTEPSRFDPIAYGALVAYCLYSVALCVAIIDGHFGGLHRALHWIDVGAFAGLLALTEGETSAFFPLFYFAILVASFSRGFREGFAVTLASVALFATVCLVAVPPGENFDFDAELTRPLYLLVLGYMIAYWGGREISHRRRLQLLRDLAGVANPRLGVDHAVAQNLWRLREFFEAGACVLVCPRGESEQYVMYRIDASDAGGAHRPQPLNQESAQSLLALPATLCIAWRAGMSAADAGTALQCTRLANLLETSCFATVPYRQREGLRGRLYVTGGKRCLNDADAEFLRQAVDQIAAAVDNLALTEAVMANASQLERERISRDIHDTTIQPYLGLKLGLEALQRKLEPGSPVRAHVEELLDMSALVIEDLRGYVARLRGHETRADDAPWPGEQLVSGLREHVARYHSFYGIEVELRSDATGQLSERVAAEAYQIVCEALSNIHRHTPAKRAFVDLRCESDRLAIEVGNEVGPGAAATTFTPRSITERASALGGTTEVQLRERGHDVVRVAIPL